MNLSSENYLKIVLFFLKSSRKISELKIQGLLVQRDLIALKQHFFERAKKNIFNWSLVVYSKKYFKFLPPKTVVLHLISSHGPLLIVFWWGGLPITAHFNKSSFYNFMG